MAANVGSVTVSLDRAHLTARLKNGEERAGRALAEQVIADSREFTPHDQGALEDSARPEKVGEDWCATWNTVYAAYQWFGCWPDGSHVVKNHDTSHNVNATTQWAEAARAKHGEKWGAVAQAEHVRGGESGV